MKTRKSYCPSRLTLEGISKTHDSEENTTPPTKKRKILSSDVFQLKNTFFIEYMKRHPGIDEFLGEHSMHTFFHLVNEIFLQWLNQDNNSQKMVYEIKMVFMRIAEEVLLQEVTNKQRMLTPYMFIIGPFQKFLEEFAEEGKLTSTFMPIKFGNRTYSQSPKRSSFKESIPMIFDIEDISLEEQLVFFENDIDMNELNDPIELSDFFNE